VPVAQPMPVPVPAPQFSNTTVAGHWRDPEGNLWTVPETRNDFDLAYRSRDGRRQQLFVARWVDGLVGTEFEARVEEDRFEATWSPSNLDRLRVRINGKRTFWTRQR
jgi:hypothetical protein